MIIIRADADETIGMGHVMRCLTIALEIKRKKIPICFFTSNLKTQQLIISYNISCECLYSNTECSLQEIDLYKQIFKEEKEKVVLVDSYKVTDEYFKALQKIAKVAYLDDNNLSFYSVDLLINYNIYARQLDYHKRYKNIGTKLLLGCNYVPLRKEFLNQSKQNRDKVKNIFITVGGSDSLGIMPYLAGKIKQEDFSCIQFHLLVGKYNADKEKLKQLSESAPNIILYHNITNVAKIMGVCDIAISAGGFTLYELCACGLPVVTFFYADNQKNGVEAFEKEDYMFSAGDYRKNPETCTQQIIKYLKIYIENKEERINKGSKLKTLVDGKGAMRIAEQLLA